jgi:hypothetical protein
MNRPLKDLDCKWLEREQSVHSTSRLSCSHQDNDVTHLSRGKHIRSPSSPGHKKQSYETWHHCSSSSSSSSLLALSRIPRALQFAFLVAEMFGCCYWRWHKVDISEIIYALFSAFPFVLPAWQQQVFLFTLWCKKSWSIWDPPPRERKQKDLQLHGRWKWTGHFPQAQGS